MLEFFSKAKEGFHPNGAFDCNFNFCAFGHHRHLWDHDGKKGS